MKTKLLVFTSLTTLLLAALCAWQHHQLHSTQARLDRVERELSVETQARADEETRGDAFKQRVVALNQQVIEMSSVIGGLRTAETRHATNQGQSSKPTQVAATQESSDSEASGLFGGKGMSEMLSKMMKDPAMKEMMRAQQKVMMNKMYGPLFKDLNLTGERKDQLMQALLDQQMKSMESADTLFDKDGKFDTAKIFEASKQSEAQSKEAIKSMLSEQEFAYYEDYKKTMQDRMQLEQLRDQLDETKAPLRDDQLRQLLALMADERTKNPPVISDDARADPSQLDKIFSGDAVEKQIQWQEEMNRRVMDRAGQILDPEQLKAYADFQTQQINMQKLGMKMMRQMFDKKSEAPTAPAPTGK